MTCNKPGLPSVTVAVVPSSPSPPSSPSHQTCKNRKKTGVRYLYWHKLCLISAQSINPNPNPPSSPPPSSPFMWLILTQCVIKIATSFLLQCHLLRYEGKILRTSDMVYHYEKFVVSHWGQNCILAGY